VGAFPNRGDQYKALAESSPTFWACKPPPMGFLQGNNRELTHMYITRHRREMVIHKSGMDCTPIHKEVGIRPSSFLGEIFMDIGCP
jgi:hypothetical protein